MFIPQRVLTYDWQKRITYNLKILNSLSEAANENTDNFVTKY
jgi:hypothetical protein